MGDAVGAIDQGCGRARCHNDAGTGLFPLMTSTLVVIVLLGFSVHVLVGLYARSMVAGAAFDGASHVAHTWNAAAGTGDVVGAKAAVRQQLNPASIINDGVVPERSDDEYIEYKIVVRAPRFLSQQWMPGGGTIERSARVRVEKARG